MEHILYWLWLTGIFGTESGRLLPLIEHFGSIDEFYKQTDYPSLDLYSRRTIQKLNNKSLDWAKRIYAVCKKKRFDIITYDCLEYPDTLRHIFVPPCVLYTNGKICDWDDLLLFGVVGTREATEYGMNITDTICNELVEHGVTIVSGFAKGIDSAATKSAVNYGAYNIVVCGCGLDKDYPKVNSRLRKEVLKNGLMITEYPPGISPSKWTFPKRNRIIAGLCKGVLVTEAPKSSGALITANYALEENRDVFAVPGKIDDKNSKGINNLIKNGAKPVFSADDILSEYSHYINYLVPNKKQKVTEKPEEKQSPATQYQEITKTGTEGEILRLLTGQDMHIDELIRKIGVPVSQFNTAVMMLEICGDVKRLAGNVFHREK